MATFIKSWTASNASSATTIVLTVPTGGVAAGNRVIVGLNGNGNGTVNTVVDSRGNTWNIDANSTATTGGQVVSAHITTALLAGDTITVTGSTSIASRVAIALEFSGVVATSALDQTNTLSQTNTAPTVTTLAAISQADELVVGFIGPAGASDAIVTSYAAGTTVVARISGASRSLTAGYRNATSIATQTISGTMSSSLAWRTTVVTYKNGSAPVPRTGWWAAIGGVEVPLNVVNLDTPGGGSARYDISKYDTATYGV